NPTWVLKGQSLNRRFSDYGSNGYMDNLQIIAQEGSGFIYFDNIAVGSTMLPFAGGVSQPSPPTITTTTLSNGIVNQVYNQTVFETGGTAPFTWSIISGSLPAGLSLNASSGVISGTPTTAGMSSFTIGVQDSTSQTANQALSITIN